MTPGTTPAEVALSETTFFFPDSKGFVVFLTTWAWRAFKAKKGFSLCYLLSLGLTT